MSALDCYLLTFWCRKCRIHALPFDNATYSNVNATYSMSMQHIQCQRNIFNVNVNPRLTLYSPDERSKQFLFLWLMWRVVYVWNKQKNNRANAAHGPSPVQIMFWDWTEAMLERRRSEPKTWTCTDTNAKLLLGCHPSHTFLYAGIDHVEFIYNCQFVTIFRYEVCGSVYIQTLHLQYTAFLVCVWLHLCICFLWQVKMHLYYLINWHDRTFHNQMLLMAWNQNSYTLGVVGVENGHYGCPEIVIFGVRRCLRQ